MYSCCRSMSHFASVTLPYRSLRFGRLVDGCHPHSILAAGTRIAPVGCNRGGHRPHAAAVQKLSHPSASRTRARERTQTPSRSRLCGGRARARRIHMHFSSPSHTRGCCGSVPGGAARRGARKRWSGRTLHSRTCSYTPPADPASPRPPALPPSPVHGCSSAVGPGGVTGRCSDVGVASLELEHGS